MQGSPNFLKKIEIPQDAKPEEFHQPPKDLRSSGNGVATQQGGWEDSSAQPSPSLLRLVLGTKKREDAFVLEDFK